MEKQEVKHKLTINHGKDLRASCTCGWNLRSELPEGADSKLVSQIANTAFRSHMKRAEVSDPLRKE